MDITALLATAGKVTPASGSDSKSAGALADQEFSLRLGEAAEQARTAGKNTTLPSPDMTAGDATAQQSTPHGKDAPVTSLAPLPQGIAQASAQLTLETTSPHWPSAALGTELAPQNEPMADALAPLDGEFGDPQQLADIRERMDLIDNAGQLSPAIAALVSEVVPGQRLSVPALAASGAAASEMPEIRTLEGLVATHRNAAAPDALAAESSRQQRREGLASDLKATSSQEASPTQASPRAQPMPATPQVDAAMREAGFAGQLGQRSEASVAGSLDMSSTAGAQSQPLTQSNATQGATGMPTNTLYTATLSAPVASPQWQQHLGQQLVGLHQRGGQQIDLHLNPSDLGPLSVTLKMSEQGAQVQFLSAHAQVRSAVEQAIPQLREALEEQGISLGEAMVGEHSQQQQQDQPAFAGGTHPFAGGGTDGVMTGEIGNTSTAAADASNLDGRVDLYA